MDALRDSGAGDGLDSLRGGEPAIQTLELS